ncbi:NUDIX hydrolase [Streptomyces sp. NPDC051000]|uniref:NUDIX hydrolase n=1 Tax=Streptomyces sp. NPDC051000 TaxID=3155520 RepID=UPI0033FBE8AD
MPARRRSLTAARRELAEEAGIRASEVELLTMMWRMPAGARTREHLYLARGLSIGEHHRDPSEADMELRWVTLDEAVAMCGDGRITEAAGNGFLDSSHHTGGLRHVQDLPSVNNTRGQYT